MSMIDSGGVRRPDIDDLHLTRRSILSAFPLLAATSAGVPSLGADLADLFARTDPGRSYDLEGTRADGKGIRFNNGSVARCAIAAILFGPGEYRLQDEYQEHPARTFRVTPAAHLDALAMSAQLLARHLPEMRASSDPV